MGEGKAWSLPWGVAASSIQKLMVHRREFILQLFFHRHPDVPQTSLMLHIWQRGLEGRKVGVRKIVLYFQNKELQPLHSPNETSAAGTFSGSVAAYEAQGGSSPTTPMSSLRSGSPDSRNGHAGRSRWRDEVRPSTFTGTTGSLLF